MTLSTAIITLLLVMDPLGNVPLFLSILNSTNPRRRKRIILRETLIALGILTLFLFFGKWILHGMQISEPALGIAGGIILFLIALRMIFSHENEPKMKQIGEPFIVPLAIPLVAGPSTLALVILLGNQQGTQRLMWWVALFIAWLICTLILLFADLFEKLLGEKGLTAMEKLMGMILTTMAVQMFLTGVAKFFHLTI